MVEPTTDNIKGLRAVARGFEQTNAMSFDNMQPHLLGSVSDRGLGEIIKLYRRAEVEGRWPEQWRQAVMVMIPKAKHATFRVIVMLCAIYRFWAKQAG